MKIKKIFVEEVGNSSSSESESAQLELRAGRSRTFLDSTPAQVLPRYSGLIACMRIRLNIALVVDAEVTGDAAG